MKILLLEDDPILSVTIEDVLEEAGFEVLLCQSAHEAMDATFDARFDLYLFDVNVPDMSGFELLKALREADDNTPTFFITALSDLDSLKEGFNVGASDYIKKPFDPEELLVRIVAKVNKTTKDEAVYYKDLQLLDHGVKKGDKIIDLGDVAYEILKLLFMRAGQTIDKSDFYDVMEHPSDQSLRVHMTKLKKLFDLELTNVRGVGYRLEKAS